MGVNKNYEKRIVALARAGKLTNAPAVIIEGGKAYIKTVFAPGMQSTGNF